MEDNNKLEMSLFDSEVDFELNVEGAPEDVAEYLTDNTDEPPQEDPSDEIITDGTDDIKIDLPDEGSDPEDVVGEEGSDDGSDDASTSPNIYSSFAAKLHNEGILPSVNLEKDKIETADDISTLIKSQIDVQTKEYLINKLGEEGYDAIEKGVSLSDYQTYNENISNLDAITDEFLEENVDLAKRVILQDYINQGLTEERAKKILNKSIDLGEEQILDDAKESVKSLRVFEANRLETVKQQRTQELENQRQQQEKIDNDLKNAIYKQKEIIQGMSLNKTIQDRIYKSITNVIGESPSGIPENQLMQDRRQNPIEFDTKLYYLYEITNGFKDFSKLTSTVTTKATSDFEKVLRQTQFKDEGGTPTFMVDPESYGGIGSEIVQ